ncbi:MAG: lysylphosphatidylglycerol synthase domain-containing protein, partial [Ktedonobacterales bacterium]
MSVSPAQRPETPPMPAGTPATGVASRAMRLFKRYKRLVQLLVLAGIAIGLGSIVWKSWSRLSTYSWHVQWGLLIAGLALFVAQELSFAFIWRGILRRMGSRLDILSSQRIYLGAEFVRYIPGNVWHVITRVLWAEQRGVPKTTGLASMVVELATKLASAALVFALSLFFWSDISAIGAGLPASAGGASGLVGGVSAQDFLVAGAVFTILVLVGLQPRLLRGGLNAAMRKAGREPVSFTLTYRDILSIAVYWGLSWLVVGAGFYLLVLSLVATPIPLVALPIAMGIYALGWDIGFVSFITPSGLGFREVAIALLLTAALPGIISADIAIVIALLARLLSTGAELVCIAGAHAIRGGTPPLQAEVADQL